MGRIITIGREFGSGGRELGRRLADELGYAYYDSEILNEIAKETEYSKAYIEELSQGRPVPLFPIHYGSTWSPSNDPHFQNALDIFSSQKKILLELAGKSDCIIIGRCADYILEEFKPFRIFIYASIDSKLARCKERSKQGEAFNDREMVRRIQRIDKERRQHYEFYTGRKWGAKENYDLMINTTDRDIKTLVKGILAIFR